ncbi:putative C6 transcription factor, partial [Myxozyma melibiosi]
MSSTQARKFQQEELVEQACDSCRRRKLKCTKEYPVCGYCRRHQRECVYSPRAIRSPLTRKYLTQVETRVDRLEALISELIPNADIDKLLAMSVHDHAWRKSNGSIPGKKSQDDAADAKDEHQPIAIQETVPDEADGFDWVEQDFTHNDLSDGMAALSINPHGSGYFGSASSAVLLRALRINPSTGINTNLEGSTELWGLPILPLCPSPAPKHVADALLDAYFSIYHTSYPFLHEETFRAQYENQIARPAENVWEILFNTVLALGAWCLVNESSCADMAFFQNVKIRLTADVFETGSLPLVQALILLSNYVQKRNRPNTGWNFLGLAQRMATGLALHREFLGWKSSPLKQEMRRRTWWGLFMFDSGAAITFGRPIGWPDHGGMDVKEVSNINDSDLTFDTKVMPPSSDLDITMYSGMIVQCRFHLATNNLYNRIISKPPLSAEQTLSLASQIDKFVESLPVPFKEETPVSPDAKDWFVFARYRIYWRYHNLRILAFRPFVLQRALSVSGASEKESEAEIACRNRCMQDAHATILSVEDYIAHRKPLSTIAVWYALYFLFQAGLIPLLCYCSEPNSPKASEWKQDLERTKAALAAVSSRNALADKFLALIDGLIGSVVQPNGADADTVAGP